MKISNKNRIGLILVILLGLLPSVMSFNSSYDGCVNITITNPTSGVLTDYPMFVNATYPSIVGNRTNLKVINDSCNNDGSFLDFDVDNYDSSNFVEMWVEIPSLTTADKVISIVYGNNTPVENGENEAGTWNNDYKAVWHLNESGTGTRYDSTQYNQDGTPSGVVKVMGAIGGSDSFDGTDDYIKVDDGGSELNLTTSSITMEIWLLSDNWEDDTSHHIFGNLGGGHGYVIRKDKNDNHLYFTIGNGGSNYEYDDDSGSGWSNGVWYHVTVVFNNSGNLVQFFRNGVLLDDKNPTEEPDSQTLSFYLGRSGLDKFWNGDLDEARVSNVSRSAEWVNASYQFVANQESFIIFGEEEGGVPATTTSTTTSSTTTTMPPQYTSTNVTSPIGDYFFFNQSWIDDVGVDVCLIETNISGVANHTMTNDYGGDIYNYTSPLMSVEGVYYWKSYSNDSGNQQNVTPEWTFTFTTTSTTTTTTSSTSPATTTTATTTSVTTSTLTTTITLYSEPNITSFTELICYGNEVTGDMFVNFSLLAFWVVLFVSMKLYRSESAFAVASFVSLLVATPFVVARCSDGNPLANEYLIVLFLLATAFSVVALMRSNN